MREYVDFDLAIEDMGEGRFRARVLNSPSGQASTEFELPFSDLELENFLLKIGRPRSGTRRLESPETEAARSFGERLYSAVFAGDVGTQWIRSVDAVEHDQRGLRLRLRLSEAPALTDLPWEYLYSPTADDFVVLSSWTPMVRYISLDKGAPPLTVAPPLRMLAMVSSPTDYPPLDVDAEWARLDESLGEIRDAGLIQIDRLEKATLRELQRALRREDYHLFHFIGHGGFDAAADDGVLLLENDEGRAREVSGRQLGTILDDARTIRLAVLNACEGARASGSDPFAGVAQSLVARGIPAVVAMQFEISDRAAIIFAHEFYTAVTDGMSVEASVGEARRAIFGSKSDVEWGTAVLYMRAEDGRLFELTAPRAVAPTVEMPAVEPTLEMDRTVTHVAPLESAAEADSTPVPDDVATAPPRAEPEPEPEPEPELAPEPETETAPEPEAEAVPEPEPESNAAEVRGVIGTEHDAPPDHVTTEPDQHRDVDRPFAERLVAFARANGRMLGIAAGVVALVALVIALIPDGETTPTTTTPPTTAASSTTTGGQVTTVPQLEIRDTAAVVSVSGVAVSVDGDLSEWQTLATAYTLRHPVDDALVENRLGQDSVGTLWVTHDDEALFLAVEVDDDVYSQPNEGNQIWRGDALDLNLFAASGGGVPGRPDSQTFQLTMTPRSDVTGDPAAVLFTGNGERFDENTTALPVVVAGEIDADGDWRMEARIPWSVFGLGTTPGNLDAALFAVFDNDGETSGGRSLQAEILTNRDGVFFQQPRTWGSLAFE